MQKQVMVETPVVCALARECGFADDIETFVLEAFKWAHHGREPGNGLSLANFVGQAGQCYNERALGGRMPWLMNYVREHRHPTPLPAPRPPGPTIYRGPYLSLR